MVINSEATTRSSMHRSSYEALCTMYKYDFLLRSEDRQELRFWEARNVKRGGELMWMDMLLIDVNSTVIQASINAHRLPKFQERLAAGKMFSISGFDDVRSAQNYKLSDSALQIRFSDSTVFDEITEPVSPLPEEGFRFRNQSELVGLANTNSHLPDIIGEITEEARLKYGDGFSQWDSDATQRNHSTILQILIDGRKDNTTAIPTLVYLSREKRPEHHHHYKAGSMNALLRVSSKITCGRIILNVDCDMYANNSKSALEALCILLDEKEGKEIGFVQFPQFYDNLTRNDLYGSMMRVIADVEFNGLDGNGGPLYVGTGCFHRREVICGRKYGEEESDEIQEIVEPEKIKSLASCTYEKGSQWGKGDGCKIRLPGRGCNYRFSDSVPGMEISLPDP